jgi:DNA polymerase elongation subunit (family B)
MMNFRDIKSMTVEERFKEISDLERILQLCGDVNVEKLVNKDIDLDVLEKYNITITPNGELFDTKSEGFLPTLLGNMYEDRKKFKDKMLHAKQEYENETDGVKRKELDKLISKYNNLQLAKKVGLNSAYGAMGSKYFRFYDLRQALAVTTSGQLSIRWIEKKINQYMNNLLKNDEDYVIASDTDSIYLRLGGLVDKVFEDQSDTMKVIEFMDKVCEEKIQPFIDESYEELAEYVHAFKQKMRMKREGLSDKGVWTAKKRYILNVYNNEGVQYKEPHLKVMGLEMVKSSTPSAIRQKMEETIKIIIRGTEPEVQEYIERFRNEFKSLPPEEISFPRGVNGLKEYSDSVMLYRKGTPIHVKGAILYNHYLKKMDLTKKYPLIQEGEKLKFTYLKQPNPFKDTVISYPGRLPPEFGLHDFVNYDLQFEKAYLDPVKIILDCIGWNAEKVNSLEDFFG